MAVVFVILALLTMFYLLNDNPGDNSHGARERIHRLGDETVAGHCRDRERILSPESRNTQIHRNERKKENSFAKLSPFFANILRVFIGEYSFFCLFLLFSVDFFFIYRQHSL